ncbi:hypothetical protein KIN20_007012 [Parelaphostrongylus tenuis]|uniref:Uncharacterized protein n=1 Tax=Parelaphostrongylus tenuis TaxID=148309 RepID=A0AAD5QJP7_PARTN|nr:hypothetical protein KIN20_007012 [Parelaphostrongylus tenuis]
MGKVSGSAQNNNKADLSVENDEDLGFSSQENHITLNMLNPERSEPRLRTLSAQVSTNGARYFVGSHRLRRKRSKKSMSRLRHQTLQVSRRALQWTKTLRNLRGRRVAQRIDERCRTAFPIAFLCFNAAYWSFYLILN